MKKTIAAISSAICLLAVIGGGAYYWHNTASPEAVSKAVVRAKLNDPDSAVFRNHVLAKRGGEGVWCGEVNARNRMGGMVGFTRYVVSVYPDREVDVLDKVTFDDGQQDGFEGKWRLMCSGL